MRSVDATLGIIWGLVVLALGVCLHAERSACVELARQNAALRRKLAPLETLSAEHQRLSRRVDQMDHSPAHARRLSEPPQLTQADAAELSRLRAEIDLLRQETNEIGTLRKDTQELHAALESNLKNQITGSKAQSEIRTTATNSHFEILNAEYWTDRARMDVTEELRDRVRGDSLKTMASNNIKGDPEFGQTKHLTIEYRVGNVIMTNEFREGDLIILPRP